MAGIQGLVVRFRKLMVQLGKTYIYGIYIYRAAGWEVWAILASVFGKLGGSMAF